MAVGSGFRRRMTQRFASIAVASALVAWAIALPLSAQEARFGATIPAVTEPSYDALFAAVLRDPSNLDLSFRFAEAATRRGDFEAAIGALERIVFYNPSLARVRLELGVLYFRLGSYEMARSYFESAISGQDTPVEVRSKVAGFLSEIDRRTNVQQFTVYAQAGYRNQTNANAGPTSQLVRAFGQDAILGRDFVNRPDYNAFGLAAVRHVYDFENQRGDVWETNLSGYVSGQHRFTRLNIGLAELQSGPRLALAPDDFPGVSIRPYGLVNAVTLGDQRYLQSSGGGITLTVPLATWLVLEPFMEARSRRFETSSTYPIANQQTGTLWASGLFAQGALASAMGADIRWQARVAYVRNDARSVYDYNSYGQFAIDIGFPVEFDGPWGSRKWALVPTAGYGRYSYDAANPFIDPGVKRRDNEYRVGALLDVPIFEAGGFAIQLQYSELDSRVRNYDTRNVSVAFGPTIRF